MRPGPGGASDGGGADRGDSTPTTFISFTFSHSSNSHPSWRETMMPQAISSGERAVPGI